MSLTLSKSLLGLEAVLVSVPSVMWAAIVLPAALVGTGPSLDSKVAVGITIFMIAVLFAAYRVILIFLISGPIGVQSLSRYWWWLCTAGAVFCLGAGAYSILRGTLRGDIDFTLRFATFGILYLLPFLHIGLECRLRGKRTHAV